MEAPRLSRHLLLPLGSSKICEPIFFPKKSGVFLISRFGFGFGRLDLLCHRQSWELQTSLCVLLAGSIMVLPPKGWCCVWESGSCALWWFGFAGCCLDLEGGRTTSIRFLRLVFSDAFWPVLFSDLVWHTLVPQLRSSVCPEVRRTALYLCQPRLFCAAQRGTWFLRQRLSTCLARFISVALIAIGFVSISVIHFALHFAYMSCTYQSLKLV